MIHYGRMSVRIWDEAVEHVADLHSHTANQILKKAKVVVVTLGNSTGQFKNVDHWI